MNITIGQYYNTGSFIHSLDPRTKLIFLLVYVLGVFMSRSSLSYALGIFTLLSAVILSKIPLKLFLKGLRGMLYFIIFTALINLVFTHEGRVLFSIGPVSITLGGLLLGLKVALRLMLLLIISSVVTFSTTYLAMADAIEALLKPFKKIGVPAHEIGMMITVSLRFVPTLFEELEKIKLAQMSRGAVFDKGGLAEKAKAMLPLLIPLFVSAFRRADNLAEAMEARGYRGDINRTKYSRLKFTKKDLFMFIYMFFYIFALFLLRLMI